MSSRMEELELDTTGECGVWAPHSCGEGGRKQLVVNLAVGRPMKGRVCGKGRKEKVEEEERGGRRGGRTPPFALMMGDSKERSLFGAWGERLEREDHN